QKRYAGFISAAPHHSRPVRTLLLRDGQVELIGNDSGVGQRNSGTRGRYIAHVAVHGGSAFIECNDATKIRARTYGLSPFSHAATPFPFRGREYRLAPIQQPVAPCNFALVLNGMVTACGQKNDQSIQRPPTLPSRS